MVKVIVYCIAHIALMCSPEASTSGMHAVYKCANPHCENIFVNWTMLIVIL